MNILNKSYTAGLYDGDGLATVDDIPYKMSICLIRPHDHIDNNKNLRESKQLKLPPLDWPYGVTLK